MLACVMAFCMCLTVFAGAASFSASAAEATNVWDGTDDYADLAAVLADLGDADADGYYHITTPNQLHAVIRLNGGGNKYKIDNDIYLNENYEDYATWGTTAPKNAWSFGIKVGPFDSIGDKSFRGTIDGCGNTVYGLYSSDDTACNALIPQTGATGITTVIKNLNVWYSYIKIPNTPNNRRVGGILIGSTLNGTDSETVDATRIEGCSVRYGYVDVTNRASMFGGIVGMSRRKTTISYCSVTDVVINATGTNSSGNDYGGLASIVGCTYESAGDYSSTTLNTAQARKLKLLNCYLVNVVNTAVENEPVYPAGILYHGGTKWGYCITAHNIYTDATTISHGTIGKNEDKTLVVSLDGDNIVSPTDANYPIRTITADSIKGNNAKIAMPLFAWNFWTIAENDYPYYTDNNKATETNVWDGSDDYDFETLLAELGEPDVDGFYHIKTPNQLHAVIALNGGGYSYKLDNDIILNEDYKNYASWGYTRNAPANTWDFTQSSWWNASAMNKFVGTIDGCGYTVYGLFSNTEGNYNGLIGATGDGAVIKNLNVKCAYLNGLKKAGVIVGCNPEGTLTVDGCSVKYASIEGADENAPVGGIVGLSMKTTVITNCAVENVKFTGKTPKANAAEKKNPYAFGSFIGGIYRNMREGSACGAMSYDQAQNNIIRNSYALNVVNASYDNQLVYVCGLFHDGSEPKWGNCITATDVYTDAPAVPESNTDPVVKLFVSSNGENINNTIKKPSVDNYAGLFSSGAWYMGASANSLPIQKSQAANFNYLDITGEGIDDAYNSVDLIYIRKKLLGVKGYEYILGDLHTDGVIDLKDLVSLKKNISGK